MTSSTRRPPRRFRPRLPCKPRSPMPVPLPQWKNGRAPKASTFRMVTCRWSRLHNPAQCLWRSLRWSLNRLRNRTGRNGGIFSSVNNNPFWMTNRLSLFPESTRVRGDSLFIAGHSLASLSADHGTPLYIYDRATLDLSVADYQSALRAYYPAESHITYAGKAFLCKAIAAWTQSHNLIVDCTGEGEIGIAVAGGVPRENILVHGVNKSFADLKSALECACTIVVDNLTELKRIHVILNRNSRE